MQVAKRGDKRKASNLYDANPTGPYHPPAKRLQRQCTIGVGTRPEQEGEGTEEVEPKKEDEHHASAFFSFAMLPDDINYLLVKHLLATHPEGVLTMWGTETYWPNLYSTMHPVVYESTPRSGLTVTRLAQMSVVAGRPIACNEDLLHFAECSVLEITDRYKDLSAVKFKPSYPYTFYGCFDGSEFDSVNCRPSSPEPSDACNFKSVTGDVYRFGHRLNMQMSGKYLLTEVFGLADASATSDCPAEAIEANREVIGTADRTASVLRWILSLSLTPRSSTTLDVRAKEEQCEEEREREEIQTREGDASPHR